MELLAGTIPRRPYADSIETPGDTPYYASQAWLVNFLRNGYHKRERVSGYDQHLAKIYILDLLDDGPVQDIFSIVRTGEVESRFSSMLRSTRGRQVGKPRVLLLQGYYELADINPAYIDMIGAYFRLNPLFLCAYFQNCLKFSADITEQGMERLPKALSHENDFICLTWSYRSHAVATMSRDESGTATIIILGQDWYSPNRITDLMKKLLNLYGSIGLWPNSTCEGLSPYIEDLLRKAYSSADTMLYTNAGGSSKDTTDSIYMKWTSNESVIRDLVAGRKSISDYVTKFPEENCPQIESFLKDYGAVISLCERNATYLQGLLQSTIGQLAVTETRKSIQQADSVRRLALVGMVFIPLGFACSFFGMNMEQLGTGTLHIGYFFLLASLSGILAWLLAASIGNMERFIDKARERYIDREMVFWADRENPIQVKKSELVKSWVRRNSPFAKTGADSNSYSPEAAVTAIGSRATGPGR